MVVPSASLRRSLVGLAIAAGVLPVLLPLLACIPVPVGDPENSRIEPGLSGAWVAADESWVGLLILRPYDPRTWLVISLSEDDPGETGPTSPRADAGALADPGSQLARMLDERWQPGDVGLYKAWLTTIGPRQFLCWEPIASPVAPPSDSMFWVVWRVDRAQTDAMTLREPLDAPPWSEVTSREAAERLLRDNGDRDSFFQKPVTFARVSPSDYEKVEKVLTRFGLRY